MHVTDSGGKSFADADAAASPLLTNLNPEQLAAVTLPAQPALILAGAGSGKTRVLTTRIAWLLATGQVSPGGVLAVTFTNKAAKEMLTRLTAMLPINVRGMWIGTFHGLCNRFLRAHWKLAALPQSFQILDSADQQSAVKRVIKAMNLDEERFVPKQVSWFIAGNKEEGQRPRDVEANDPQTRKMVEIYQAYEDQCQREGVVDFAELMLRSYELLRDHDPLREHYQRRFAHVLVDEFQDTNRLQYRWLQMFAPPHGAAAARPQGVFAVGDDDQSIYAFRGAQVGNMALFEREYGVRKVIKLERNYRSFGNILDTANALISHNDASAWARTCAPRPAPASRCASSRPTATMPRRNGCSTNCSSCTAPARRAASWRCCTAATHKAACWRARCSTPGCRTACTAACASSSAPRSSTRWPTCG